MRNLLEAKEILKKIYSKYEVFIMPVLKFVLAFTALLTVNSQLGYMGRINNIAIVLIVALFSSFLPVGFIILFAGLFVLLHFYALAIEIALAGFCIFLVMFLLFFRFSPKDSLVVLLTPICFALKIPYVIPISMGLIGTPASSVSVGCGVVIYYLVSFVSGNAKAISALGASEATAKLKMVIDGILNNKAMIVTVAAFAITVIVVYVIRRMAMDHSWTIAMVAGTMINVVILLIGDLMYDTNVSVIGVLFGSILSLLLVKGLQFFVFCVDYSRTEKVQFEDDEYYYYVKAVPKMTVTTPTKTVKKINTQARAPHAAPSHATPPPSGRPGGDRVTPGRASQTRTVTTERTGNVNSGRGAYTDRRPGGKSVTTGRNVSQDTGGYPDDFEEL